MKHYEINYDKSAGILLLGGNKRISASDVKSAVLLKSGLIQREGMDIDDSTACPLLCLTLSDSAKLGLLQKRSEIYPVKVPGKEKRAKNISGESIGAPGQGFIPDEALKTFLAEKAPDASSYTDESGAPVISGAIVEAKASCNNYIKAATTGINPYGRIGQVTPVVDVKWVIPSETLNIRYLGTTSKMHKSKYYAEHSEIEFKVSDADHTRVVFLKRRLSEMVSVDFEIRAIERDENASGLWQVHLEYQTRDYAEGAAWANAVLGNRA